MRGRKKHFTGNEGENEQREMAKKITTFPRKFNQKKGKKFQTWKQSKRREK